MAYCGNLKSNKYELNEQLKPLQKLINKINHHERMQDMMENVQMFKGDINYKYER